MLKLGKMFEKFAKICQKTKANYLLSKKVIDRMEFLEDGKITFSYITKPVKLKYNLINVNYYVLI